jgi:predicted Zn-dependent protease
MSTVAMHPALTRAAAARRSPRTTTLRLTRRGRVAVVLAMMGMVLVLLAVFGPRSAATGEVGTPVRTRSVEVAPGDTLWTIASDVAGPGQVRDMVHRIEELNALNGPAVAVGQEIAVPVG